MSPQTRNLTLIVLCLSAILWLAGCASSAPEKKPEPKTVPTAGLPIPDEVATVLPEGSVLLAHTAAGKLKIEAGPDSLRIFSWEDARRGAATTARDEPFPGADSVGLHYDGKPPVWKPYEGINKLVYEESTRSFESPIDLKIWTQIRRLYFSYNDDGLAVGWKRDGDTLHVEVWQFYINGEKPDDLPDADNNAVKLKTKAQLKAEAAAAKAEAESET